METKKSNSKLIISIVIGVLILCCSCLVVAAVAVGLFLPTFRGEIQNLGEGLPNIPVIQPEATEQPRITVQPLPTAITPPKPLEPGTGGGVGAGGELVRLWASGATASSAYANSQWAAKQATGAPDTAGCGDSGSAWASADSSGKDWIELTYDQAVYPTEVNIYISYNPNQVVQVDLIDVNGTSHTVYTGEPQETICPQVFNVPVADGSYATAKVRISVDQSARAAWNEIDAVELVGKLAVGVEVPQPPAATPLADLPTPDLNLNSIPAGSFYYSVSGASENAIVDGGTLQNQSTSAEYVLGLVGKDTRYALSLFLPLDVNAGMLTLKPYDDTQWKKGPSATMYIGANLYYAGGGILIIDSVKDGRISGTFVFSATHASAPDQVLVVTGAFKEIPLK